MHHQEVARKVQRRDDLEFPFDLRVSRRRALPRPVPIGRSDHDQLAQPAVFGVTIGGFEGREFRGDQRQFERTLFAEIGCCRDDFRALIEYPCHLIPRAQVRTTPGRQPAGRIVEGLPRPDGRHGHRQAATRGLGEVRRRGGDHTHTEASRKSGERGIAFIVERVTVVGQFDTYPVGAETVRQISQRCGGSIWTTGRQCLPHMAFAASGENVPVPAGGFGESVVVIAGLALLTADQVRGSQLTRQSPVALWPAGQDQQVGLAQ